MISLTLFFEQKLSRQLVPCKRKKTVINKRTSVGNKYEFYTKPSVVLSQKEKVKSGSPCVALQEVLREDTSQVLNIFSIAAAVTQASLSLDQITVYTLYICKLVLRFDLCDLTLQILRSVS